MSGADLDLTYYWRCQMATSATVQKLSTLPERVSVLEIKVENIDEKLVDLKADVKEMHDCLDQTRDKVMAELDKMQCEYRTNSQLFFDHADKLHNEDHAAHEKLAVKIADLEKFRMKGTYMILGGLAVLGWVSGHIDTITKLFQ
jgi:hypothetical protein